MPDPLQISEALDEELELIQAKYPSKFLVVQDAEHPVTAALRVRLQFASATATVVYPPEYPSTPATTTLSDLRGGCLAPMRPAPQLSVEFSGLAALAQAWGWAHECDVAPDCGTCRKAVDSSAGAKGENAAVVLQPCLHTLHAKEECFGGWYQGQIRYRREMEAKLRTEMGSGEAERKAMEGWPKCVVCRQSVHEGKAKQDMREVSKP